MLRTIVLALLVIAAGLAADDKSAAKEEDPVAITDPNLLRWVELIGYKYRDLARDVAAREAPIEADKAKFLAAACKKAKIPLAECELAPQRSPIDKPALRRKAKK